MDGVSFIKKYNLSFLILYKPSWRFLCAQLIVEINSLNLIKRARVFLSTLQTLAILRRDVPFFNSSDMSTSLPDSLYLSGALLLPFGRPRTTPSAFLLANASLVRWLIRLRSISADKPKAKARTLL